MSADDPSNRMSWVPEPDPDRLIRWSYIAGTLMFLMAGFFLAGELLGWWNDLGEVGVTITTLGGLLITLGAAYFSAGQKLVEAVHGAVVDNGKALSSVDGKLDTLDDIQWALDEQTGVLTQIRDRL